MPRNATHIPESDLAIFRQCRRLNVDIDHLRNTLPEPNVIAALERVNLDELPLDQRRMAACILRDRDELAAKEADLKALAIPAELAAQRIPNANLRRITRLYCIDGMRNSVVKQLCPCCERTVDRWIAFLNGRNAEGNADGATD